MGLVCCPPRPLGVGWQLTSITQARMSAHFAAWLTGLPASSVWTWFAISGYLRVTVAFRSVTRFDPVELLLSPS